MENLIKKIKDKAAQTAENIFNFFYNRKRFTNAVKRSNFDKAFAIYQKDCPKSPKWLDAKLTANYLVKCFKNNKKYVNRIIDNEKKSGNLNRICKMVLIDQKGRNEEVVRAIIDKIKDKSDGNNIIWNILYSFAYRGRIQLFNFLLTQIDVRKIKRWQKLVRLSIRKDDEELISTLFNKTPVVLPKNNALNAKAKRMLKKQGKNLSKIGKESTAKAL